MFHSISREKGPKSLEGILDQSGYGDSYSLVFKNVCVDGNLGLHGLGTGSFGKMILS